MSKIYFLIQTCTSFPVLIFSIQVFKIKLIGPIHDEFRGQRGLEILSAAVRGVALKVGLSNKSSLWKGMSERLVATSNTEERDQLLIASWF